MFVNFLYWDFDFSTNLYLSLDNKWWPKSYRNTYSINWTLIYLYYIIEDKSNILVSTPI